MSGLDLDKWLTEIGDQVVRKAATNGFDSLDASERLIYQMWLFDTEQRNGGVSQYFCNRGMEQWNSLARVASQDLKSFAEFADAVNRVISCAEDAYRAVMDSEVNLDTHYEKYRHHLLRQLKVRWDNR